MKGTMRREIKDLSVALALLLLVFLQGFDDALIRAVLATGQSGQPLSKHWGDQTPLWLRGELHPMWFTRSRITDAEVLVLRPR